MTKPVRVLIVDDSALMRELLHSLLSADPGIAVVGAAGDPLEARERIKALDPDVVTLDVEMPEMDGVTFLRKIMALRPTPVVMISTLTQTGAAVTLEALEIGAVDCLSKPATGDVATLAAFGRDLCAKVKTAAQSRVRSSRPALMRSTPRDYGRDRVVAIGASTGGVEALKALLTALPARCPPILITQHMPARFTAAFAERLNRECPMTVTEARHDEVVAPDHVYIAPGAHHLELARVGARYVCRISDAPPVSGHRPSVDVLFRSAAAAAGAAAVGVILTGMGRDGAEGMLAMRQAGAVTLGQDAETSLIYGMPRAAHERGGVMRQCALAAMPQAILDACAVPATSAVLEFAR